MPRTRTHGANALAVVQGSDLDGAEQLEQIADFAQGLKESFLYCREMGHNWRPLSAGRFKDGGFERILRCSRCRTERHQEITARGIILSNIYKHPEGYLSDIGRIVGDGRGILRLESIRRIVAKAD